MKKAFTTAELLIAMTIVGVVATLVVPGFIRNYQSRVYTAKIQKTYSIFSEAIERACSDMGVSNFAMTPYSKSNAGMTQFVNRYIKTKNMNNAFHATYRPINSNNAENVAMDGVNFTLQDGQAVNINCEDGVCNVHVDTNAQDEPNIGGRDFFSLAIDANNNTIVAGESSDDNCVADYLGGSCFTRLINNDWNMNY